MPIGNPISMKNNNICRYHGVRVKHLYKSYCLQRGKHENMIKKSRTIFENIALNRTIETFSENPISNPKTLTKLCIASEKMRRNLLK